MIGGGILGNININTNERDRVRAAKAKYAQMNAFYQAHQNIYNSPNHAEIIKDVEIVDVTDSVETPKLLESKCQ